MSDILIIDHMKKGWLTKNADVLIYVSSSSCSEGSDICNDFKCIGSITESLIFIIDSREDYLSLWRMINESECLIAVIQEANGYEHVKMRDDFYMTASGAVRDAAGCELWINVKTFYVEDLSISPLYCTVTR